MTARAWPGRWRELKRGPLQGSSPNDRILRGPACHHYRRVCAGPLLAAPSPPRLNRHSSECVFLGMTESIGPIWSLNPLNPGRSAAFRSAVGPGKRRDGRSAPCSSSAMSSGRLILDQVARQQCPSPLHRHAQTNIHFLFARPKPDISTLQRIGHFYFALTVIYWTQY